DRLAAALRSLGVGKGDVVAMLGHDRVEVFEHFFACMKIGALRTGINWRYSEREMLHILRDCDARILIVHAEVAHLLEEHLPELRERGLRVIGYGEGHGQALDYEALLADSGDGAPALPDLSEDDPVAVSYTSGTTGLPKGALLTQRGVRESLVHTTLAVGLRHADVWASVFPASGITLLIGCFNLVNGMTTVLPDGYFQPKRFLELVEERGITSTILVPTMLKAVTEERQKKNYDTSSLRLMAYGSMPATPALIRRAHETFGCGFQHWYGATEGTGGWYAFLLEDEHQRALDEEPDLLTSCGTPLLHIEMTIRGPEGEELPPGGIGEVWVGGDTVMSGYLNRPDENEEVFAGSGWLRTGDLGKFDERGYLYLVDRKKFMIISGGFNVYPVTVENALAEHPAVREVSVLGLPHPDWGEAVVAAVVLAPDEEASPDELIEFCRGKVGRFEVPKHVEVMDELPKGVTAKVQKHEIKAWFEEEPGRVPWKTIAPR
ncbi:MAG: class I adenylate-forming enzyme family protein, partial [Rubrobacteraceae bacterium]